MEIDPDWDLCSQARHGSVEAYAQLRQKYQGRVRAELQQRCPEAGHADLEDLAQQVWIAVWTALPRYRGDSAFPTWLVGVAKNVLHAWLRHKHSDESKLLGFEEINTVESHDFEERDPLKHLTALEAINQLPETEHTVIELRYFEQYADQEIATRLQLPLGTVKGRIRRGLAHLRENFKSGATEPPRLI